MHGAPKLPKPVKGDFKHYLYIVPISGVLKSPRKIPFNTQYSSRPTQPEFIPLLFTDKEIVGLQNLARSLTYTPQWLFCGTFVQKVLEKNVNYRYQ